MTDQKPATDDNPSLLQEEYLKSMKELEEGQLIEGTVIELTPEFIFIDVGYKSEGKIPASEFETPPALGDKVKVVLISKEGKNGDIIVSKNRADVKIIWKELRTAFQDKLPVQGTVVKAIKGGFEVNLGGGIIAFNPLSKMDVFRVENPEEYVGLKSKFMIDRLYSENKVKIVLSRRQWLEKDIEERKRAFFEKTQPGDDVEGIVKSFTSFGAFIDLGGFDGLLHINDMSWGHVNRPRDFVKKGQKITLKVIRLDPEQFKINLSLKHFTPDPWTRFEENYHLGDVVKGRVSKLADFGAFIELEDGIEGLAHISELSWVKRVNHPQELLSIGDPVEAKILNFDTETRKIALGLKQVLPNPWDDITTRYSLGARLTRRIKKVSHTGAFIEIEDGIDGFLHIDDISWTRKIKNLASVLKVDEEIEVVIIAIDPELRRFRLGVKQLSQDPWQALKEGYPRGSLIEGEVTNITDFGMFVKVPGDIEGLINKNQIAEPAGGEDSPDHLLDAYKVGDKVKAYITEINIPAKKLSLSIREYQKGLQREELSKYIHDEDNEQTFTLGDYLKKGE
ncbi:MAG: 30S ribosomal protein S1 [Spirochaetales bacterium]|jgi:small subunit ribosomal protein S1|nr:30S ribosomal protein S1 [Spirochaetales bacterium]